MRRVSSSHSKVAVAVPVQVNATCEGSAKTAEVIPRH